jgi:uncharacterized protein
MADFIGRQEELGLLNRSYEDPGSAFVPIYGRRRVGKSELILQFMKGRPGVYFVGKKAPAGLQIKEFLEEAAAVLDEPLLASFPAESWGAAFRTWIPTSAAVSRGCAALSLVLVNISFSNQTVGAEQEATFLHVNRKHGSIR